MVDTTKLKDLMLDINRSAWYLDQLIQNIEANNDLDNDYMLYMMKTSMARRKDELEGILGLEMSNREKRVWNETIFNLMEGL